MKCATERIDWHLRDPLRDKDFLVDLAVYPRLPRRKLPTVPSGGIHGIANPSRPKPCSAARAAWSIALCLRPTYSVVVSVTKGLVFNSSNSWARPLMHGAVMYVCVAVLADVDLHGGEIIFLEAVCEAPGF